MERCASAGSLFRPQHCGAFGPGNTPHGDHDTEISIARSTSSRILSKHPSRGRYGLFLLRLADFCRAPRRALAKNGALRQQQLAVSAAGGASLLLPLTGTMTLHHHMPLSSLQTRNWKHPSRGRCGLFPLVLSQFSRRAALRPCENWSAAPATARCIRRRRRSAQLPDSKKSASFLQADFYFIYFF